MRLNNDWSGCSVATSALIATLALFITPVTAASEASETCVKCHSKQNRALFME